MKAQLLPFNAITDPYLARQECVESSARSYPRRTISWWLIKMGMVQKLRN
jgi:hypothetical protein